MSLGKKAKKGETMFGFHQCQDDVTFSIEHCDGAFVLFNILLMLSDFCHIWFDISDLKVLPQLVIYHVLYKYHQFTLQLTVIKLYFNI